MPPLGEQKGTYIKYEISEKAFLGGIPYDDYQIIPENKIKISMDNPEDKKNSKYSPKKEDNEKNEERVLKVGEKIEFNDILNQMAYWAEQMSLENSKEKSKNKRKIKDVEIPDINILQMFKLYPKKMDEMKDKIKIMVKN